MHRKKKMKVIHKQIIEIYALVEENDMVLKDKEIYAREEAYRLKFKKTWFSRTKKQKWSQIKLFSHW